MPKQNDEPPFFVAYKPISAADSMLLGWMCLIGEPIKIRWCCIESSDPHGCYLDMLQKYEEIGYIENSSYRCMLTFYLKEKKLRGPGYVSAYAPNPRRYISDDEWNSLHESMISVGRVFK